MEADIEQGKLKLKVKSSIKMNTLLTFKIIAERIEAELNRLTWLDRKVNWNFFEIFCRKYPIIKGVLICSLIVLIAERS